MGAVAFPVLIIPINPHVTGILTVTGMATIVWQVAQALAVAFPVLIIPINPHVMVTRTVTGTKMLPHLPVKKKMASMLLSFSFKECEFNRRPETEGEQLA